MFSPSLLHQVRDKFAHIDKCPFNGERIFFENAGGALTLKTVVKTSSQFAALPDNQGRANKASRQLAQIIQNAKNDAMAFLNAERGDVFVGESGTELLFRLIRSALGASKPGGIVVGTTLEHPASRSAAQYWARESKRNYCEAIHDNTTGCVEPGAYCAVLSPDTRVATIVHTSPVTGMRVDVAAVSKAIRAVSPDCFIIVDGIQHAAHGGLDIASYNIDGYVISPYKCFSRHGYGLAWVSDRLKTIPHEKLNGTPQKQWELGTRDTGAYATFSDVVTYFEWLGGMVSEHETRQERLLAAGKAIHAHEKMLVDIALYGSSNLKGLTDIVGIDIIGGANNSRREGLIAFKMEGMAADEIVEALNIRGILTHTRKADHYSANVLKPLGFEACVRVSFCHYNSPQEVEQFLHVMHDLKPI